jgi:Tol biopolymer transport system component
LLVSGPVAQEKLGIWMISIIGTSLKKLRDDAHEAALSADGSQIAFVDQDQTAIWVMAADGSHARPLIKAEGDYKVGSPAWFANGKRLFYGKWRRANGNFDIVFESRNLQGSDPVVLLNDRKLVDVALSQPGRIVYSISEPPPNENDSNLWELYYDVETGKPRGTPRQLTQWTGFSFQSPGITEDGKHFVFLNSRWQSAVYFGELADGGNILKPPQRLTLTENLNIPGGWSPDSKTVFFSSDREGSSGIYKQGISDHSAQPVATGPEEKSSPQVTPDGNWVIYLQWHKAADGTLSSGKLMRVPIGGGPPEDILNIEGPDGSLTSFRCPYAGVVCVMAEKREKQLVFSTFDPTKDQKAELVKLPFNDRTHWNVSPDGTRLAISEFNYKTGEVSLVPLNGATPQRISAAPWTELTSVAWAADGKSLFLASFSSRGTAIVHLDLAGQSKLLFRPTWYIGNLNVSLDGKYLALGATISNSNAWTMGFFPAK